MVLDRLDHQVLVPTKDTMACHLVCRPEVQTKVLEVLLLPVATTSNSLAKAACMALANRAFEVSAYDRYVSRLRRIMNGSWTYFRSPPKHWRNTRPETLYDDGCPCPALAKTKISAYCIAAGFATRFCLENIADQSVFLRLASMLINERSQKEDTSRILLD